MGKYLFLFKKNNTNNRGYVAYIEKEDLKNVRTDWCGKFSIISAGVSILLSERDIDFENITTILTKQQLKQLCNPEGQNLIPIIKVLESEKNKQLFEKVQQEEIEWIKCKYNFSNKDIETIFNNPMVDYIDRGIVDCVYKDTNDLGCSHAYSYGMPHHWSLLEYFDCTKLGEDLLRDSDFYIKLEDGRVVCLNYWYQ